jgi:hypothetical protein
MFMELFGYSHRMIITLSIITMLAWWPCWWMARDAQGIVAMTVTKLIFHLDNFFMGLFWFLSYSIAKGNEPSIKEVGKFLLTWLVVLIISEIPIILAGLAVST